jgi:hypothetical protein
MDVLRFHYTTSKLQQVLMLRPFTACYVRDAIDLISITGRMQTLVAFVLFPLQVLPASAQHWLVIMLLATMCLP